ncbi:cysteine desulfurase family protein [Lysinibacter sp. HNR]|uniref:cysteine desulfurase family protein n=1 Tax=Lysinibacter sp. HNR TaxID=3031408 RepID=UPI00243611FF|nr:cysteine desulfurase family protein [Lysinibacter sp. HNR]WGD38436.1 cysteine desulfurase family protein [Lysinibacter sp. HNR]
MSVYLDHAATTPMRPEVLSAYVDALSVVGNPASIHNHGQRAKRMLEEARERVAATIGCEPVEVVFTGGGTEAINLAIKGLWWARQQDHVRPHLLVPGGEHHATVDSVQWLTRSEGAIAEWLPVDHHGRLNPEILREALQGTAGSAALTTAVWGNNEVGTVQPVAELAKIAAEYGVPFHVDAVAALGYLPLNFAESGASAMSISAHKIGGPVGIGALVLGRRATVVALQHGGGQQRGRSGTQDVAGAIAFAVAAEHAHAELETFPARLAHLRDELVEAVQAAVPEAVFRGAPAGEGRLPGNAHFTFPGCEGDSLLFLLDAMGVSASTGSACQAGVPETSHVLTAMGIPESQARGALRFTLGHGTTSEDIAALAEVLPGAYERARAAGLA